MQKFREYLKEQRSDLLKFTALMNEAAGQGKIKVDKMVYSNDPADMLKMPLMRAGDYVPAIIQKGIEPILVKSKSDKLKVFVNSQNIIACFENEEVDWMTMRVQTSAASRKAEERQQIADHIRDGLISKGICKQTNQNVVKNRFPSNHGNVCVNWTYKSKKTDEERTIQIYINVLEANSGSSNNYVKTALKEVLPCILFELLGKVSYDENRKLKTPVNNSKMCFDYIMTMESLLKLHGTFNGSKSLVNDAGIEICDAKQLQSISTKAFLEFNLADDEIVRKCMNSGIALYKHIAESYPDIQYIRHDGKDTSTVADIVIVTKESTEEGIGVSLKQFDVGQNIKFCNPTAAIIGYVPTAKKKFIDGAGPKNREFAEMAEELGMSYADLAIQFVDDTAAEWVRPGSKCFQRVMNRIKEISFGDDNIQFINVSGDKSNDMIVNDETAHYNEMFGEIIAYANGKLKLSPKNLVHAAGTKTITITMKTAQLIFSWDMSKGSHYDIVITYKPDRK